jgi:hypothetical protein
MKIYCIAFLTSAPFWGSHFQLDTVNKMNPQQLQNEEVDAKKKTWETPELFDLDVQHDTKFGGMTGTDTSPLAS